MVLEDGGTCEPDGCPDSKEGTTALSPEEFEAKFGPDSDYERSMVDTDVRDLAARCFCIAF